MAIFSNYPKVNPAFSPSAELLDAADSLSEALDARVRIDLAIAKNAEARTAAGSARQAAEAEVEALEMKIALEIDEAQINTLETALASARTASTNALEVAERADRLRGALHNRATEADTAIAAARQVFQTAIGTFGREVSEVLAVEAREAAQQLVKVLMRGSAIAASLGTLSHGSGFLGETTIPSPAPGQQPIVSAGRADLADGTRADLAAAWRDDPAAAALADLLQPLTDLRRRAASHSKFTPPPPVTKPYEVQNYRSAEEIAAERAAAAAWQPPKSTFQGQVFHLDERSQPQRVEINAVAGIADGALAERGAA